MDILVDTLIEALPSLLVAVTTLGFGWLITQRISARWDLYRKRRELDLAALGQFYTTYGTFFSIWKLWTCYPKVDGEVTISPEERQDLLDRASAVEGSVESLLVKLAVERDLQDPDQVALARFREGVQCLRESIEDGVPVRTRGDEQLTWSAKDGPGGGLPYESFKRLAGRVALIASSAKSATEVRARVEHALLRTTTSAPYRGNWWKLDLNPLEAPTRRQPD